MEADHMPTRHGLFNGRTGAGAMTEWDKGAAKPRVTSSFRGARLRVNPDSKFFSDENGIPVSL
jgi:hypothetical protein